MTTICPGWIRTPMTCNLDIAQPHLMEVEEAARRIVEAIRRRRVFLAMPAASAWRCRLLGLVPSRLSDWLLGRMYGAAARQAPPPAAPEG